MALTDTNCRKLRKCNRTPFSAASTSNRDAICFRLRSNSPDSLRSHRIALVGEAAHVLPPIGAQGLNMGLRDAADIADVVREAILAGEDPGAPQVLDRYNSARRADVASRTFVIDIANRSLLSDFLPMQIAARGRTASDRRVRTATPHRHARGPGAVMATHAAGRLGS